MARKIYKGFLNEKPYVQEPFMVKTIPFLKAISSTDVLDRTGILLGMNDAVDTWHGRTDQDKFLK